MLSDEDIRLNVVRMHMLEAAKALSARDAKQMRTLANDRRFVRLYDRAIREGREHGLAAAIN